MRIAWPYIMYTIDYTAQRVVLLYEMGTKNTLAPSPLHAPLFLCGARVTGASFPSKRK